MHVTVLFVSICSSENKFSLFRFYFFIQVATDKCIMLFLFFIVCGVIAIIVVKVCALAHIVKIYINLLICNHTWVMVILNCQTLLDLLFE